MSRALDRYRSMDRWHFSLASETEELEEFRSVAGQLAVELRNHMEAEDRRKRDEARRAPPPAPFPVPARVRRSGPFQFVLLAEGAVDVTEAVAEWIADAINERAARVPTEGPR